MHLNPIMCIYTGPPSAKAIQNKIEKISKLHLCFEVVETVGGKSRVTKMGAGSSRGWEVILVGGDRSFWLLGLRATSHPLGILHPFGYPIVSHPWWVVGGQNFDPAGVETVTKPMHGHAS
jgi:hypothetical protein